MDEQATPVTEAVEEPAPEATPAKLPIERSWMAKMHQHGGEDDLPRVGEIEAAIEWALNTRFGSPTRHYTVSAEII
jgi:hypothetical protein